MPCRGFVRRSEELVKSPVKPNYGQFGNQEINAVTDNFSYANLIGQGGFATVYQGKFLKRIGNDTAEGNSEFLIL
jgi:hypothetical protein